MSDQPKTMTLTLDPPIKWTNEEPPISELTLAEPTVEEWEKASRIGEPIASNILLVSLVATRASNRPVPEAIVRKLRRGELLNAIGFFDACTAASQAMPGMDTA